MTHDESRSNYRWPADMLGLRAGIQGAAWDRRPSMVGF
jgi:hypothetical protein